MKSDFGKSTEIPFRRFFYWLSGAEFEALRAALEARRFRMTPIKGVPCKALHSLVDLAWVAPETWDKVCYRQGSWYRESALRGRHLVVSARSLRQLMGLAGSSATPDASLEPSGVIEDCDFQPDCLADGRLVSELIREPEYQIIEPSEWSRMSSGEVRYWRNLLRRIGHEDADLRDLLRNHSANHANFVAPVLAVKDRDGRRAPYSIGRTWQVCSACIELFNILGARYRRKYVMPCPGCVLYSGRPADRYLLVKTASSDLSDLSDESNTSERSDSSSVS